MKAIQRQKFIVVLLALSLCVTGVVVWAQHSLRPKSARPVAASNTTESLISGYRQWAKVNPHPLEMFKTVAELCAAPTLRNRADSAKPQADNPHFRKFITVYVNPTGRAAMLKQKTPHFPVGSVIVKEKLAEETSKDPELLTVMVKREAGYNPASGDWEYLVMDGKGEKVTAQGKLESCNACHTGVKDNDYIFRSYLPRDAKAKLR